MTVLLKKSDIALRFSVKVCKYLESRIDDTRDDLNKILISYFDAEIVYNCLFRPYRDKAFGFNRSLAIEFLCLILEKLTKRTDFENFVIPSLKGFLIELESQNYSREEILQVNTIKVYPYIQSKLKELTQNLNGILIRNFDEESVEKCLYARHRHRFRGFNNSFSIEFLIDFHASMFLCIKIFSSFSI